MYVKATVEGVSSNNLRKLFVTSVGEAQDLP